MSYINTYRASRQLVNEMHNRLDPNEVPSYTYYKPQNMFQMKQFNKDRIEYEDDL